VLPIAEICALLTILPQTVSEHTQLQSALFYGSFTRDAARCGAKRTQRNERTASGVNELSLTLWLNFMSYMCVLSKQWAVNGAEAEVVTRRDDVTESRVSQLNVLCGRIDDVLRLRVDAVNEVHDWPFVSTLFTIYHKV